MSPDTSRLQEWLNIKAAWHSHGGDLQFTPSAGVAMESGRYHRHLAGHLYGAAWEILTWARWMLRRGPRCGDRYCWHPEHWPRGQVLLP